MYPHELSGGMKQRAIIAAAIALKPQLIIADEPTTALDVTIQRVILETLLSVRERLGSAIIVVTHDMPVHAQLADRLVIMYAGKIMEIGTIQDLFNNPLHPYSQGLIATIPSISKERKRLQGIPGIAPSPLEWPTGCRFHPRCERAMEVCEHEEPKMRQVRGDRMLACHLYS
jgi:oligopeptide/dipeptide ABC transporter ATP-binding protein